MAGNDALVLSPARLDPPWLTRAGSALEFWAPASGATTPGSTHPRTELVGLRTFTLGQGPPETFRETAAVLATPDQSQNIIIGQLFASGPAASPYVMLHYRAGEIYVFVVGQPGEIELLTGVPLGADFTASITAHGQDLTFTAAYGGRSASRTIANSAGFAGKPVLWHAGDYQQDVPQGAAGGDGGVLITQLICTG
jgi:hypothetical protein